MTGSGRDLTFYYNSCFTLFILLLNLFCSIGGFYFINNNSEGNKTVNGDDDDDNVIDYFYDCDGIDEDGDNIDDCYGDSIDDGDDTID